MRELEPEWLPWEESRPCLKPLSNAASGVHGNRRFCRATFRSCPTEDQDAWLGGPSIHKPSLCPRSSVALRSRRNPCVVSRQSPARVTGARPIPPRPISAADEGKVAQNDTAAVDAVALQKLRFMDDLQIVLLPQGSEIRYSRVYIFSRPPSSSFFCERFWGVAGPA